MGTIQLWRIGFETGLGGIEKSIAIWRELESWKELTDALVEYGVFKIAAGDHKGGMESLEEGLRLAQKLDDPKLICRSQTQLCFGLVTQFQPDKAEPLAKECIEQALKLGMPREITDARHFYADCALEKDAFEEAEKRYSEALKAALDYGDIWQSAAEMQGMAMGIAGQGRHIKALRLNGAVLAK